LRIEARPEVRPFKWIGAKVSRRLAGIRGANRMRDGRIEAVLLPPFLRSFGTASSAMGFL